jgi:hypothetical protein
MADIPMVTVKKIIGAINTLMIFIKLFPIISSFTANEGNKYPMSIPAAMAKNT